MKISVPFRMVIWFLIVSIMQTSAESIAESIICGSVCSHERGLRMSASVQHDEWIGELVTSRGLSPALRRVADIVARNPRLAAFADTTEIAMHADVNSSSVARCAQALGYKGWTDFQQDIRGRYLASLSMEETIRERADESSNPVIQAIAHDVDNMRRLAETIDVETVSAIAKSIASARSTIVIAAGAVLGPASVLSHLGRILGYPIRIESSDPSTLTSVLNIVGPEDVVIVFSHWRSLSDVTFFSRSAVKSGVKLVTLTDSHSNAIAQSSDLVLVAPSEGSLFFQSVTALTSVVYSILAALAAEDQDRYKSSISNIQNLWKDLGIHVSP